MLCGERIRSLAARPGSCSFTYSFSLSCASLAGLIDVAALRDELGLLAVMIDVNSHSALVIEFPRFDLAALDGPEHIVCFRFRFVQFLQLGLLRACVLLVDLLELIGERADLAAGSLKGIVIAARWRSSKSICWPICWSIERAASVAVFTSPRSF